MKTVIVFDTTDEQGMRNTIKIVEHLARQYLNHSLDVYQGDRSFGKIKFIKAIRSYADELDKKREHDPSFRSGLKSAKQFADDYWKKGFGGI